MKLFNKNRYTQIYFSIIENARSRDLSSSCEVHHIIPRCMGGNDDPSNLIRLTPREHFMCHKLLTKFTTGDDQIKLQHAVSYMVFTKKIRPNLRVTSRDYETARKYASSTRTKTWGENISKAKLGQKSKPEAVAKMRQSLTGRSLSSEHRDNIRKAVLGRKHQESSIKKCAESKAKKFIITRPNGAIEEVLGLKQWCITNGFNYHTLHNSKNSQGPINRGPLKGFKCTSAS